MTRISKASVFALAFVASVGGASCSSGSSTPSGGDGGARDGSAARDGSGSGSSSKKDAAQDARHDGSSGAGSSTGSGSGDARVDTGVDAHVDAFVDSGRDAPADTGKDSGEDAHVDSHVAVDSGVDAGNAPPPSCVGIGAGIGSCGAAAESCCTSPEVQGGMFSRTYTNTGTGATGLANPANLTEFRLDKYLVTVARFRKFRAAVLPTTGVGWLPAAGAGKHAYLNGGQGVANVDSPGSFETGWLASDDANVVPTDANLACKAGSSTWSATAGDTDPLPINCVNWYEAYAFCIWDGGFLPSDAEWGYAAAGGPMQLEYPWGSASPGSTNTYAIYGCHYPSGGSACAGVDSIAQVGSAPMGISLWGQLDMVGDMYAWNLDLYGAYPATGTCTDCAALGPATGRVVRGGDFQESAQPLLSWQRSINTSTVRLDTIGIRCARTPIPGG